MIDVSRFTATLGESQNLKLKCTTRLTNSLSHSFMLLTNPAF
jgi:hypothetical protein